MSTTIYNSHNTLILKRNFLTCEEKGDGLRSMKEDKLYTQEI